MAAIATVRIPPTSSAGTIGRGMSCRLAGHPPLMVRSGCAILIYKRCWGSHRAANPRFEFEPMPRPPESTREEALPLARPVGLGGGNVRQ